jgi:hypothetical protein
MGLKLTNNAASVLTAGLAAADTQLSVSAGHGAKFPALAAGDWFPLTIVNTSGDYEIVRCTARVGDIFTIVRGLEGTVAANFAVGDYVDLRMTAAALAGALRVENNFNDLTDKPAAREALGLHDAALKGIATVAQLRAKTGTDAVTVDAAWDAAKWVDLGNLTGAVTIDASTGVGFRGVLTGNVTIDVTNLKDRQPLEIILTQDATGSRTVSWNARFKWPSAAAPEVSTTANTLAVFVTGVAGWDASTIYAAGWKVTA